MTLNDHYVPDNPYAGRDRPVRLIATVVAVTFVLVGVLGFVPGVTTNYDELTLANHHSMARLLGLFQVSVLHNIVHLLFGVVGLILARRPSTAVAYLIGGGVVYAALFVYGVVIDQGSSANFVPVNDADNALHFALALAMVALGLLGRHVWRGSNSNRMAM
jgi:hypothetical protein